MRNSRDLSLSELIHLKSKRGDWTAAQWKVPLEAARADLRHMLMDLSTLTPPVLTEAYTRSLFKYIVQSSDLKQLSEIHTNLQVLVQLLLRILDAQWHYDDTICRSRSECHNRCSPQCDQSDSIRIYFYRKHQTNIVASTNRQRRNIIFNTALFPGQHPKTDTLTNLFPLLDSGDALDHLYKTLTPTLLHGCLHLACDEIKDVWIRRSDLPPWVDSSVDEQCDGNGFVRCYSEDTCQMLTSLAHKQFPYAHSRTRMETPYLPHEITFRNADNITRALCSIWLSQKRQDLDFFPNDYTFRPTIEREICGYFNRLRRPYNLCS